MQVLTRNTHESVDLMVDWKVIVQVKVLGKSPKINGRHSVRVGFEAGPEVQIVRSELMVCDPTPMSACGRGQG